MTAGHLPAVDSKKTPVPEAVGSGWSLPRGPVLDREGSAAVLQRLRPLGLRLLLQVPILVLVALQPILFQLLF